MVTGFKLCSGRGDLSKSGEDRVVDHLSHFCCQKKSNSFPGSVALPLVLDRPWLRRASSGSGRGAEDVGEESGNKDIICYCTSSIAKMAYHP